MASSATLAMAGGLAHNTNASTTFFRNPAREGYIETDGVYYNPAGTAFLSNGVHISLSIMEAKQSRTCDYMMPTMALNSAHMGDPNYSYKGEAFAPVIPSLQFAYNWDRWNLQFGFGLIGGGGKLQFNKGLGMFEAPVSALPMLAQMMGQQYGLSVNVNSYAMNMALTGESYTFSMYLGTSYEIIKDKLAVSAGVRGIYASNHYYGGLSDIKFDLGDGLQTLNEVAGGYEQKSVMAAGAAATYAQLAEQYAAAGQVTEAATAMAAAEQYQAAAIQAGTAAQLLNGIAPMTADMSLDCNQKGFSATAVIGIDYRPLENLNFSARFESPTPLTLTNNSVNNEAAAANAALANYQDGVKTRADLPLQFAFGTMYAPIQQLRLSASYHFFDDKHAVQTNDPYYKDNKGTHEALFGIEGDVCKWVTLSMGYQGTFFGQSDREMSDMNFNLNNHSIAAGLRINCNSHWKIDLGYFHSFYTRRNVDLPYVYENPAMGIRADLPRTRSFMRYSDSWGVQLTYDM